MGIFLDHLTAGSLSPGTKYSSSWEEQQNSTITTHRQQAAGSNRQSDARQVAFHQSLCSQVG